MNKNSHERYTEDFKQSSVKFALESNQPYAQIARDLGIKPSTLYTWIEKHNKTKTIGGSCVQEELKKLRSEVSKLRTERDILKKAAVDSIGQCIIVQYLKKYRSIMNDWNKTSWIHYTRS